MTVLRRGRERLHYLNPAPIHESEERWISGFDKARMRVISTTYDNRIAADNWTIERVIALACGNAGLGSVSAGMEKPCARSAGPR